MRYVTDVAECRPSEYPLQWNAQTLKGPASIRGPTGSMDPMGYQDPPGRDRQGEHQGEAIPLGTATPVDGAQTPFYAYPPEIAVQWFSGVFMSGHSVDPEEPSSMTKLGQLFLKFQVIRTDAFRKT